MTKKLLKSIVSILLAVFMLVPLTMTNAFAANDIKISKSSLTITEGKTSTLKVTGTSDTITWSSSNESIATVSKKGVVSAKAVGKATITAKVGKTKLTCEISVKTNKILTSESTIDIVKGDSASVTIKIKDIDDISYGSTDKSVCTVKMNSKKTSITIKAVGKGTASIKIYSKSNKELSRVIKVNVFPKVSSEKIVGTQKGDTYSNSYFNLKIDLSGYEIVEPDYYYGDDDYQYSLIGATNENEVHAITVYDIPKTTTEMEGLKSTATASQFLDYIVLSSFEDEELGVNTLEDVYAMTALIDGADIKRSSTTIAGKKYSTLYIAIEMYDSALYINVAAIKKDNHVLIIASLTTEKGAEKDFYSRISALK